MASSRVAIELVGREKILKTFLMKSQNSFTPVINIKLYA